MRIFFLELLEKSFRFLIQLSETQVLLSKYKVIERCLVKTQTEAKDKRVSVQH